MNAVLLVGRVLFALIFINSGIAHLTKTAAMTGYAQYKKVPAAKLGVIVSGLMILVGGLAIALGVYADLGALLIAIFLVPTLYFFQNFWVEKDPTARMTAMTGFMKDLALLGAALFIFAVLRNGVDIGAHVGSHLLAFKK